MLIVQLDSVYMKVPFKPLMKLNIQAYEQCFQTQVFRHSGYCSQLHETIEFRRIDNLVRTQPKVESLKMVVMQIINGRQQPCGRLELRLQDLGRGLQMQRLADCQDRQAAVTFTAQLFETEDDSSKDDTSGSTSTQEDSVLGLSAESSKECIRILSSSLYKHRREACSTNLHKTYSKELDKLHSRYTNIVGGITEELERERNSSKRKEYELKTNHKDTVHLYKRSLRQLQSRVAELEQTRVEKEQQQTQTQYVIKEECSISTEATGTQEYATQVDELEKERIELELRNAWQQTLHIPHRFTCETATRSSALPRRQTLTEVVSSTFEQLTSELSDAQSKLAAEQQARQLLSLRLDELAKQYEGQLSAERIRTEEVEQDIEILRNKHLIQLSKQEIEFQRATKSLEQQFEAYKHEIAQCQSERIQELEEEVREQLEAIQFRVAARESPETAIAKTHCEEASCQCDILSEIRNKLLDETLEDNSRLSEQLQQATQHVLDLQERFVEVQSLAEERLSAINKITEEHNRIEQQLQALTFEHNCLLEVSAKLNEEKQHLVKLLVRYEEQGKELYTLTKNFTKKKESRENTLDRIQRSEKSRGSKRSKITNRKNSGVKPHPVLLVDPSSVNLNAASNLTNNSNSSNNHPVLLKVPKHHVGRTSSMQFDDKSREAPQHSSPSEAPIVINAARTEVDAEESESEEFDLSDEEQFHSDPIIQHESSQESEAEQNHTPMALMARFKESLLAAHREIDQQKDEVALLDAENEDLRKKNAKLEEAVNATQSQVAQTRINLESIIEELRKDLDAVTAEKESLASECEQLTLQKETLKAQYRSQLQSMITDYNDKEASLTEGFRAEVERLMQQNTELQAKLNDNTAKLREELDIALDKIQVLEAALECMREQLDTKEDEFQTKHDQYQEELEKNVYTIGELEQMLGDQHKELVASQTAVGQLNTEMSSLRQLVQGQKEVLEQKTMKIIDLTEQIEELQESATSEEESEMQAEEKAMQTDQVPSISIPSQQTLYRPISSRRFQNKDSPEQQQRVLTVAEFEQQFREVQEKLADKEELIVELTQKCLDLNAETSSVVAEKDEQLQASLKTLQDYTSQIADLRHALEKLTETNQKMQAEFDELLTEKNAELAKVIEDFGEELRLVTEHHHIELQDQLEESERQVRELRQKWIVSNISNLQLSEELQTTKQRVNQLSQQLEVLRKEHKQTKNRMEILDSIIAGFDGQRQSYLLRTEQLFQRTITTLQQEYNRQLSFELQRVKNKIENDSQLKKAYASQHATRQSPDSSLDELLEEMADPAQQQSLNDARAEAAAARQQHRKELQLNHQFTALEKELEFTKQELEAGRLLKLQLKKEFRVKLAGVVRENIRLKNQLAQINQQENRKQAQHELLEKLSADIQTQASS